MSRWTTPSWWACSSASAACTPRLATVRKYAGLRVEPSVERTAAGRVLVSAAGPSHCPLSPGETRWAEGESGEGPVACEAAAPPLGGAHFPGAGSLATPVDP